MTASSLLAKRSDITYEAIPMPTSVANTTAKAALYDLGDRVRIGLFARLRAGTLPHSEKVYSGSGKLDSLPVSMIRSATLGRTHSPVFSKDHTAPPKGIGHSP